MGDTNYFSGIVKVLETPRQSSFNDKTLITQFRAEISQFKKNKIIHLIFWGNLAQDIQNFYKTNDYLLVEGYLSQRNKINENLINKVSKYNNTVTVLRVYPFLLNSDCGSQKI